MPPQTRDNEADTWDGPEHAPVLDLPVVPGPGDLIAGCRLEALAGAGGMGMVFRAVELDLNRVVALKLISPERAGDTAARERFILESRAAARLDHPHVVPIYRAGEDRGRLHIVMRHIAGTSLQAAVDRTGPLSLARTLRIVAQVAAALDAAHQRELVHRDVKPSNVLLSDVDGAEHAYLGDFGLSVAPYAHDVHRGPGLRPVGTYAYLAPEQINGGRIDGRADVYALGCVLYTALTGRPPFLAGTPEAVMLAHVHAPIPRVTTLQPHLPRGVDELILRALAKDPADRYPTAGELARAALALRYDIALFADPTSRADVDALAVELRTNGFDVLQLPPTCQEMADELRTCDSCGVIIDAAGLGAWARDGLAAVEVRRQVDRSFQTIAILTPGAPEPDDPSLAILASHPYVDARERDARLAGLDRLLLGSPAPSVLPSAHDVCPYRGLVAFASDDADEFVGREQETVRAIGHLRTGRFLAVVAASGAGKSSFVGAGLIPALRAGALPGSAGWTVVMVTPGGDPAAALAAQLTAAEPNVELTGAQLASDARTLDLATHTALAGSDRDRRIVLVIDQLEEVFTLCSDPTRRRAFLDALVYAATIPSGRVVVIASIRADFAGRCTEVPRFGQLVADHQLILGPMDPRDLRRVIEEPAARAGLEFEPGLVRTIMDDVQDRPGTLPHLQHLLLELWRRRRGRTLTLAAYSECGGVDGALTETAETVYDALGAWERALARRVFLRLTTPGDGAEDTRRRVTMAELAASPGERDDIRAVVDAFVDARLLTTNTDPRTGLATVEIAHEALLRAWPTLRGWLDEDREALRLHRHLTAAADDWVRSGHDDGGLYRGARLAQWNDRPRTGLNRVEHMFLDASGALAAREVTTKRRRTRVTVAGLAGAVAAIGATAVVAVVQRDAARSERTAAVSRQIAVAARSELETDPQLALLLAQRAFEAAPTDVAEGALRQAVFTERAAIGATIGGGADRLEFTAGGAIALLGATGFVDTLELRRGRSPGLPLLTIAAQRRLSAFMNNPERVIFASATAPDGLAITYANAHPTGRGLVSPIRLDERVAVFRLRRPAPPGRGYDISLSRTIPLRRPALVREDEFFDNLGSDTVATGAGGVVATADAGGTIRFAAPGRPLVRLGAHAGVTMLRMSADGRRLAGAGRSGTAISVWDTRTGRRERSLGGHTGGVAQIELSRNGERLVSLDTTDTVRIWRPGTPGSATVLRRGQGVSSVAISGDGRRVAVLVTARDVVIYDADTARTLTRVALPAGPSAVGAPAPPAVALNETGGLMAATSRAVISAWELDPVQPLPLARSPRRVARGGLDGGPDARLSVITTTGMQYGVDVARRRSRPLFPVAAGAIQRAAADDQTIAVLDARGRLTRYSRALGARPTVLRAPGSPRVLALAVATGRVVTGAADGRLRLWTPSDTATPREFQGTGVLSAVAVVADGQTAVSGTDRGAIRVWDLTTGISRPIPGEHAGAVLAIATSTDGRLAASAGADGTIRVWDLTQGRLLRILRGHVGAVRDVAFNRDGSQIVSAGTDRMRVWRVSDGATLVVQSRLGPQSQARFDADGTRIVSVGGDGLLRVWDCQVCGPIDDVLRLAASKTQRQLTPDEIVTLLPPGA